MLMKKAGLTVWLVLSVACASNTPGASAMAPDPSAVRAAVVAANGRFVDAFKRGDKAGLVANYADDALLMMPNEETWSGRAGIDSGFSGVLSHMSLKDGGNTTTDVIVAGDIAVETGTFTWTFQMKSGSEVKDKGKYITVWKRQTDGTWKIVRDINNTDLPATM